MGKEVAVYAAGVGDDDHLPAVMGIDLTADEPARFEAVDHSRDRARGQAGELGETSRRRRAVEQEKTKRPDIRLVEADLLERLEVGHEELDHEVTQLQLQIADGVFTRLEFWFSRQSISVY